LFGAFFIKYSFQQSKDTKKHIRRIEPLTISGEDRACFDRLRTVLGKHEETTIIKSDASRIQDEFKTVV